LLDVVMIEHETHSVPVAVDAGDAAAERLHQVIEGREQDIGQDGPFQMAPEAFNQIQSWTVRRQPVDRQLLRMSGRHGGTMLGSPWQEV
jgi:hypothetical protein